MCAPTLIALAQGVPTKRLAGADQRRGTLELLQRQQPQRVAHQHRQTVLTTAARHRARSRRMASV